LFQGRHLSPSIGSLPILYQPIGKPSPLRGIVAANGVAEPLLLLPGISATDLVFLLLEPIPVVSRTHSEPGSQIWLFSQQCR
ncbi:MAG: hypothetical protein M3Y81_26885, partial [Chloroflexota bacterium]|nr:hypothetical protein [Chloroflexota bacterium]